MITREEAKYLMKNRYRYSNKTALDVVDEIYDSMGTCSKCIYFDGVDCNKLTCSYMDTVMPEDEETFFCSEYEKNEDQLKGDKDV